MDPSGRCPECGTKQPHLRAHLGMAHPDVVRVRYRNNERLVIRQSPNKRFGCPKCGFSTSDRNSFIRHASQNCPSGRGDPSPTSSHAAPTRPFPPSPSPFHLPTPPSSLFEPGRRVLADFESSLPTAVDRTGPVDPQEATRAADERIDRIIDRRAEEALERERRERERPAEDSEIEYASDPPSSRAAVVKDAPSTLQPPSTHQGHQQAARVSDSSQNEDPVGITVPWDEDTYQDREMVRYGLVINRPLKIAICIGCKTVVDPKLIYNHVHKEQRQANLTKTYCEALPDRFSLTPKSLLEPPPTLRPAIPCLELKEGYVYCTGCNRAMEHERSLKASHRCHTFEIKKGFAQAFFPHSHQGGYFAVTLPHRRRDAQPVDAVRLLKNMFQDPPPEDVPITLPANPRDANHFLELKDWVPTLGGLTGSEIQFAVRDINPALRELISDSLKRYMAKVEEALTPKSRSVEVVMGSYTGECWTTDPFKVLQRESSKRAYRQCGTDLITFVVGGRKGSLGKVHVELTDDQKALAEAFVDAAKRRDGSDMEPLQDLFYSLFTQELANQTSYAFPVYRFLVLYSFRRDGTVHPCNEITQIISKLVFWARGCILKRIRSIMDHERCGFFSVQERFQRCLSINSDYPLCVLYNDRNLLKKLVEDQVKPPDTNIVGRTAILHDTVISLDDIGDTFRALLKDISDEERDITLGLSDTDPRFHLKLPTKPSDEPNSTLANFFFADIPRNGLVGVGDFLLDVFVNHPRFRDRYFIDTGREPTIAPTACSELLQRFDHLRSLLLAAVHISSGGPARGTEIASQHLRNAPGGDIRNVQIIKGKICFVGGYNKTTHQTEKQKVMYRFPPDELAPYLLREWLIYRPLQVLIARATDKDELAHRLRYLVFPGLIDSLESADVSNMLRAATMAHVGYEIGLHDWRAIESTLVQHFCDRADNTHTVPAHYSQRGHSIHIGRNYYGQVPDSPGGVPYQVMDHHFDCSRFWQDLTNIQKLPVPEPGPHGSLETSVKEMVELRKDASETLQEARAIQKAIPETVRRCTVASRPNASTSSAPPPRDELVVCPHPSSLTKLRDFRKEPRAQFTCPEQAQALEAVLARSEHVFLVGPTGMGKTTVFLIPAIEHPQHVTIVLVPLSALRVDFSRRCRKLGIACSEWTPTCQFETTIVMVSPEHAAMQAFLRWATNLKLRKRLLRLVYDEVHLCKMHEDFRLCFASHRRLIETEVPLLLMTATCPPDLEGKILETVGIESCRVIRAPTPRPEISYNSYVFSSERAAEEWLVEGITHTLAFLARGEKGIIYCRGHETTERLAALLHCPSFHRDERDDDELRRIYDDFVDDDDQNIIVATSLLGVGVDIAHVRHVWHFGLPWSLIDYVQETGRGGRDGKPASSHLLTWEDELKRTPQEPHYTEDVLRRWVVQRSGCRRTLLGQVLDQRPTSCVLLRNSNLCDHCRADVLEPHPGSGVGLFQSLEATASAVIPRPPRLPRASSTEPIPLRPVSPSRTHVPQARKGASDTKGSRGQKCRCESEEPSERPDKQVRAEPTRPPAIVQMEKKLFLRLLDHAKNSNPDVLQPDDSGASRKVDPSNPNDDDAEGDNLQIVLGSEARFNTAKDIVGQVRKRLNSMKSGGGKQDCSVCLTICGEKNMGHVAGGRCRHAICGRGDADWQSFKTSLEFRAGYLCYHCLLPTSENTNAPGAVWHDYDKCNLTHLIRPALYAFWVKAPSRLREYVLRRVGVEWSSLEEYISWCTSSDRANNLPNHLVLFWCILKYWDKIR